MLRPDRGIERVYLHRAPIDMRKQIDGLSLLARDVMQLDPLSGALFAFINARRNKLKLLLWERNGFIVWYKESRSMCRTFIRTRRQDLSISGATFVSDWCCARGQTGMIRMRRQ